MNFKDPSEKEAMRKWKCLKVWNMSASELETPFTSNDLAHSELQLIPNHVTAQAALTHSNWICRLTLA